MTDLLDTPSSSPSPAPSPSFAAGADTASVPPTPPPPAGAPDAGPPRRSGRRFVAGLATGVAVSAMAVGGAVLVDRSGDDADAAPVTTVATEGAAAPVDAAPATTVEQPAVTVVPQGSSIHDLVVAVRPSIVAIHTTTVQTDVFGQQLQGEAAGSGWVWSADGLVITNHHVIEGASEISVTFGDGTVEEAELVASDARSDLAVLRVDRDDLVPLTLGDSDAIRVGDPVVAIGNALDLGDEPTVTGGIISAKDRTIQVPSGTLVHLLQTDAAISSGNSGGPLLDLNGRVVGINTAVASRGQNIGFAIAIDPAREIIDSLRNGEAPRQALLGVSTRPTLDGTDGALVIAVEPGSGADRAGVEVGDVIVELDGDRITSPDDLVVAILSRSPGDAVQIVLVRDGDRVTIDATLGAHDEVSS